MKKNRSVVFVVCLMVVGFLLAGCATTTTPEKKAEKAIVVTPTNLKDCKNFKDAGQKMITSVLDGLSTGNYAMYSRDFSEKNKKYFDRKVFTKAYDAIKEELGKYKAEEFIGFWKKGDYEILLWKTQFSKTKDDILVQMYVKKTDKTYQIAALKLI